MGKMGEAANLGAVAIAAFIVYKVAGFKFELPKFELPQIPLAPTIRLPRVRDIYDIPDIIDDTLMVDVDPFIPAPTIADLGLPSPTVFRDIAADHAARVAASRDVLEAAKLDLVRFQTYLNGNADVDAGGSIDMDPSAARKLAGIIQPAYVAPPMPRISGGRR